MNLHRDVAWVKSGLAFRVAGAGRSHIVWCGLPPAVQAQADLSTLIEFALPSDPDDADPEPALVVGKALTGWESQTTRWHYEPQHLASLPKQDKTKVRKWIRDVRQRLHEMEDALREG